MSSKIVLTGCHKSGVLKCSEGIYYILNGIKLCSEPIFSYFQKLFFCISSSTLSYVFWREHSNTTQTHLIELSLNSNPRYKYNISHLG